MCKHDAMCFCHGGGRGLTCHDFGYRRAAGVPGSHPIHKLGEVKNIPIHILPIATIVPIHIHLYYFSNFTHSYTFWVKKIPHWYTFKVKMIPSHVLGGLKSIPLPAARLTFIMEVAPPVVFAQQLNQVFCECHKLHFSWCYKSII